MYSAGFHLAIEVPDFSTAFMRLEQPAKSSWFEIAADNTRFYDESFPYGKTHYKTKMHGNYFDTLHQWVGPVHMIFDESVRKGGPLVREHGWNNVVRRYRWSKDNSVEVDKGWILKADSIAALADLMGRDREQVQKAVEEFNKACDAGQDSKFNRDPLTLEPVVTPPFYAVQIKPIMISTSGGGRRNPKSEVLDRSGNSIPGLYEAGQLGSMISFLYQNGTYLTEAMISGRAAGRNAAKRIQSLA